MELADFERLLDQMPQLRKLRLFNWGEPLLHPDIHRIVAAASRRGLEVTIHSNLSFTRPEGFFPALVRSGLHTLVASVDGASQRAYEAYRRGGSFELVLTNLAAIREAKREAGVSAPAVVWKFIVNRYNEHEIEDARRLAESLDAAFESAPMGLGGDIYDWTPQGSNAERAAQWLPQSKQHWSEPIRNGDYDVCSYDILDENGRCTWLWTEIVINPRGYVLPCCFASRDSSAFGNALESSVAEVWSNSKYARARALFSQQPPEREADAEPIICERCPVLRPSLVPLRVRRKAKSGAGGA
jgi:radical SAM protein with 4Fe4S-binding SPASM domain